MEDIVNTDFPLIIKSIKTWERSVQVEKDKVVKRQLSDAELMRRPNGAAYRPFWAKERLQNEAAALDLVASKTSLPVPRCRLYTEDGLVHLEMERMTTGVLLEDIPPESRQSAAKSVDEQIRSTVLPQLQSLRRDFIGSADPSLPVFPPQRVYYRDRRDWARIRSETDEFVFCHNDLSPQNIFIDPEAFHIVGIIDWEFSGYFPPHFELPLWSAFERSQVQSIYEEASARELALFGLKPADLEECMSPS
ncbi:aminoglycoside phosphotransferase [Thozetella sp. PMI_491]|nr:aminoglycoside phosphotransferase [Thozetella sp. PMI_491]